MVQPPSRVRPAGTPAPPTRWSGAGLRRVLTSRVTAMLVTAAIFVVILRNIRFDRLVAAVAEADLALFAAAMAANTVFYFCWDTLVLSVALSWFHAPVRYRELLPVRAVSYVVGFFNTNAGRGALAAYLARRLGAPFLQLGSTVMFLVMSEYLHLLAWGTVGLLQIRSDVSAQLLWVPPIVALLWVLFVTYIRGPRAPATPRAPRSPMLVAPREWALLRTFRLAPPRRYAQMVLLRAPMFFVSLCLHYVAARAFGLAIPFWLLVAFLPVIFMVAALPITVAHLGTTQAAWLFFFSAYAPAPKLLAFSLAAHLTFTATRALLGVTLLPWAYADLTRSPDAGDGSAISSPFPARGPG